ncbi:MAG TPA: hypothetical protein VGL35_03340 [Rhizomicrobium sp.]|jgi:hypothetical protein
MRFDEVAEGALPELNNPVAVGKPVDVHVVPYRKEPSPDFEAMRRLVEGGQRKDSHCKEDAPHKDAVAV